MKKYLLLASIPIAIVAVIFAAYYMYWSVKYKEMFEMDAKQALGIEGLSQREEDFMAQPTLDKAVKLADIFAHIKQVEDLQKAIFYGTKSIELGCNDTCWGSSVNLWLAGVYHKKKNDNKACQYLKTAVSLDKEGAIEKYDYYSQEGLDSAFLQYCKQEKVLKRNS